MKYYVRSTVLSGQVVTELNATGGKQRTFVYAGGQVLAWQRIFSGVERVTWEHRDPGNASFRTTNEDGSLNDQTYVGDGAPAELDPSGSDARVFDPYLFEPPPEENQGSLISHGSFDDAGQLGTTYSWDGIPMPADEFFQIVNTLLHGRFGIAQALMRGTRVSGTRTITATGTTDDRRIWVRFTQPIYGTDPMAMGLLFSGPQNPAAQVIPIGDPKTRLQERLKDGDCEKYVKELIAKVAVLNPNNPASSAGIMDLYDKIISAPNRGFVGVRNLRIMDPATGISHPVSGLAEGSLLRGNARSQISLVESYGPPNRFNLRHAAVTYGITVLHEVIHHSGSRTTYSDFQLAEAAKKLNPDVDWSPLADNSIYSVARNSGYWDSELKKHCAPLWYYSQ